MRQRRTKTKKTDVVVDNKEEIMAVPLTIQELNDLRQQVCTAADKVRAKGKLKKATSTLPTFLVHETLSQATDLAKISKIFSDWHSAINTAIQAVGPDTSASVDMSAFPWKLIVSIHMPETDELFQNRLNEAIRLDASKFEQAKYTLRAKKLKEKAKVLKAYEDAKRALIALGCDQ